MQLMTESLPVVSTLNALKIGIKAGQLQATVHNRALPKRTHVAGNGLFMHSGQTNR